MSYRDKEDPGNDKRHNTGKLCVETGCNNPAGTAWSPF